MKKDYYNILGIEQGASKEDIKSAYYILAQQFHPDKNNGNEKRFKEINEAYRILSDSSKRAEYDRDYSSTDHKDKEVPSNEKPIKKDFDSKNVYQAICIVLVVIVFIFLNKQAKQPSEQSAVMPIKQEISVQDNILPQRYGAGVIQIGGEGSRTLTKSAYYLDEHGYLEPVDNYVSTSFNNPGDLMWVSCKDGYFIESATSSTGNSIDIVDGTDVSVLIENSLKNIVSIVCTDKRPSSVNVKTYEKCTTESGVKICDMSYISTPFNQQFRDIKVEGNDVACVNTETGEVSQNNVGKLRASTKQSYCATDWGNVYIDPTIEVEKHYGSITQENYNNPFKTDQQFDTCLWSYNDGNGNIPYLEILSNVGPRSGYNMKAFCLDKQSKVHIYTE